MIGAAPGMPAIPSRVLPRGQLEAFRIIGLQSAVCILLCISYTPTLYFAVVQPFLRKMPHFQRPRFNWGDCEDPDFLALTAATQLVSAIATHDTRR
jgi:hypothetical protein